ncbi:hypothetical protein SAMN05660964_00479 [Thiothrix caldifontis]|uniref:TIR domain-containing protein n=1 Tax=Thiothrix caldifontis TaxID=525918 RepID=A0A1H3WJU3_9GAMM|nr:TIR domain-containing protein [Thiothrix caldifontis]SDZ87385.1 hypothetical protein SAMN05660964_00479 [Thiothrix caldifontis]
MILFTEANARNRAKIAERAYGKNTYELLREKTYKSLHIEKHDIFMSHAYTDREIILGITLLLEDLGYTVYLDWRDDPYLDRSQVSKQTASKLKIRMKASRCLFYSTTSSASTSKWMPWELGFKDGDNKRSAILPIAYSPTSSYEGQEYLGIYPYIDVADDTTGKRRLWVRWSESCYVNFDSWLDGYEPSERQ